MKKDRKLNRIQRRTDRFNANPANIIRHEPVDLNGMNGEVIFNDDASMSVIFKDDTGNVFGFHEMQEGFPVFTAVAENPKFCECKRGKILDYMTAALEASSRIIGDYQSDYYLIFEKTGRPDSPFSSTLGQIVAYTNREKDRSKDNDLYAENIFTIHDNSVPEQTQILALTA